jgi:hypothetical protein
MTGSEFALFLIFALAIPIIVWYGLANLTWYRIVRKRDPDDHVDAIAEPVRWAVTALGRERRLYEYLRTPTTDPELELWRRRTIGRLISAIILIPAIFVLVPPAVRSVTYLASTEFERAGLVMAVGSALVFILGIGYFAYRFAAAAIRRGHGAHVARTEFAVSLAGIVGFIVAAWFFAASPWS